MALFTSTKADLYSFLKWLESANAEADQRPPRGAERSFQFSYGISTGAVDNADDRTRLLYFPAGIFLLDYSERWTTAVDIHATPTFVHDVITENAAASADTLKIVSASTAGRAVNSGVAIDAAAKGAYVGERYLVLDTTTAAATPQAGAVVVTITVARGIGTSQLPSLTMDAI